MDSDILATLAKLPAAKGKKQALEFAKVLSGDVAKLEKEVKRLEKALATKAEKLTEIKDLFRKQTENAKEHERIDDQLLAALSAKDTVKGEGFGGAKNWYDQPRGVKVTGTGGMSDADLALLMERMSNRNRF